MYYTTVRSYRGDTIVIGVDLEGVTVDAAVVECLNTEAAERGLPGHFAQDGSQLIYRLPSNQAFSDHVEVFHAALMAVTGRQPLEYDAPGPDGGKLRREPDGDVWVAEGGDGTRYAGPSDDPGQPATI